MSTSWGAAGATLWDGHSFYVESGYQSTGLICMWVTSPNRPPVWSSSLRFVLTVGCLREASAGTRISQNTKQTAVVGSAGTEASLLVCMRVASRSHTSTCLGGLCCMGWRGAGGRPASCGGSFKMGLLEGGRGRGVDSFLGQIARVPFSSAAAGTRRS